MSQSIDYNSLFMKMPWQIREKMLEEQVAQCGKKDINVFIRKINSHKSEGGFSWDKTSDGFGFWRKVIDDSDYELFFETYDRKPFPNKWITEGDSPKREANNRSNAFKYQHASHWAVALFPTAKIAFLKNHFYTYNKHVSVHINDSIKLGYILVTKEELIDNLINKNKNETTRITETIERRQRPGTAISSSRSRQVAIGSRPSGNSQKGKRKTIRVAKSQISSSAISI